MGLGAGQKPNDGDFAKLANSSYNKPAGRLVAAVAQALADNTFTAIQFAAADELDSDGYHNPSSNNTRVTPTRAGWYRFTGTVWFEAMTTPVKTAATFRKNGTLLAPINEDAASTRAHARPVSMLISLNGSTDYVELVGLQDSAGADNTNTGSAYVSVMEWEFVRDL
jgi:hypothetical protein